MCFKKINKNNMPSRRKLLSPLQIAAKEKKPAKQRKFPLFQIKEQDEIVSPSSLHCCSQHLAPATIMIQTIVFAAKRAQNKVLTIEKYLSTAFCLLSDGNVGFGMKFLVVGI